MRKAYLNYWPWELATYELDNIHILAHDASDAFIRRHLEPGDIIWYVTIPRTSTGQLSGQLYLFGRLEVGQLLHDSESAQRYLEQTFDLHYDVRPAHLHVFACPGTQDYYALTAITSLAPVLRFQTPGSHDRLTVTNGLISNPYELRTMRVLTPASTQLLLEVWNNRERTDPEAEIVVPEIEPDDVEFPEGSAKLRSHLVRERNRELVRQAKQRFRAQHGRLFCQACGFDFAERYGLLGEDYIEAHHTVPVSELRAGDTTRIEDLAMVCSNCHRMLHRRRPWLTIGQLQAVFGSPPNSRNLPAGE